MDNILAGQRPILRVERKREPLEERLVRAIQQVGPRNIALLARMTRAHPETIRYKVKRQFKKLGLRVHAEVDYRKLGLVPFWGEFSFSPRFGGNTKDVLSTLSRSAYLVYYGKLMPQGSFACLFAAPQGKRSQHEELLNHMKRTGILDSFTLSEVVANRVNGMNPQFFDFRSGNWEIDWNEVRRGQGSEMKAGGVASPARVDLNDALMIKELQADSLQHLASIARKVKVPSKTLEYHYRVHVQEQELIPGYVVRWVHDIESTVAHSVLVTALTFRNLGSAFGRVQRVVSKIPFLWAEYAYRDETYLAFLYTPVRETEATLRYLSSEVPDLHRRVEISFVEKREASAFTIPYEMFRNGWIYDLSKAKAALSKLNRKRA